MNTRFQYSRRQKNPPNSKRCGRGTRWGNPFEVNVHGTHDEVVELYRQWLRNGGHPELEERRQRILNDIGMLRGKNIGCACRIDQSCHCDVLIELLEDARQTD